MPDFAPRNARLQRISEAVTRCVAQSWYLARRLLPLARVNLLPFVINHGAATSLRRIVHLLLASFVVSLTLPFGNSTLVAQELTPAERTRIQDWYVRTVERTGDGQWGMAIGTMDGRILWSLNPELELIPASTAKLFTTGFTRAT